MVGLQVKIYIYNPYFFFFLQKPVATFHLIIGVAIAVIGASFQYGYNIAVVNAPADVRVGLYVCGCED